MNLSNLDKHNPEQSFKDKFSRRRSLSECAASSSTTSDQNYDVFNIKTREDVKILSKNYDGMEEHHMNVFSKWNHCELLNSAIDSSVTAQEKIFETHTNLGAPEIIRSVSELNISDSLEEENKNVSKEKIFNDFESISFDEISSTQSGQNRKNWRKYKNNNERSQSRYDISKKKTTVDATQNNEARECIQDAMVHNISKPCTKSKRQITKNTNTNMSNYNEKIRLYCLDNKVLIIMEEKSSFCFTGKLMVNVLYGTIEIYGFHITSSNPPIEVYSPKGYSLVAVENSHKFLCSNKDIWTLLSKEYLLKKILNRWQSHDWSCTLIAGGKIVGKSTTVRYLINTLLSTSGMVVLVDVDLGQSECTPPGSVSYSLINEPLTGPNFTHLSIPVYQLYIGDVNVTRCMTRYIESLKLLANKLLSCPVMSRLPIVINTMGFTDGIGWDIIVFTIKLFQPSFVVQIMSEKTKNNYANLLSNDIINSQTLAGFSWSKNIADLNKPCSHELYVINTNAEMKRKSMSESLDMEPYQQRELAMISYLSGIINSNENTIFCAKSASLNINEAIPYVAPFASLSIVLLQKHVPSSQALTVIDGNMVALCGIDLTGDLLQEAVPSKPRILTRAPLCSCYGYGIIRGVDMEKEEIYIVAPLPLALMQHVNCLIGSMPMPVNLLQLNQTGVPYAGGNNILPTSRDPRRGYFRMRHKDRRTSD